MLLAVLPILFEGTDTSKYITVPAPGIDMRQNLAMATSAPWVNSNIWQFRRAPGKAYFCDVTGKSATLAMAEAHSQGVELALRAAPEQRKDFDAMIAFLKSLPEGPKQAWANLLFTATPAAKADLKLKLDKSITNPYDFAQETRQKLGEKRLVRIYGSEITLADLKRDRAQVRLALINYGRRPASSLRVRVRGHYSSIRALVYEAGEMKVTDQVEDGAFTEFSLPSLPLYAVIDLRAKTALP